MACGGCRKRSNRPRGVNKETGVMGSGYAHLTDRQIRARLEVYKKKYCQDCDNRYKCDYEMYVACRKKQ